MRKSLAFFLVWICSGITFFAYQSGNEVLAIISSIISTVGYFILVNND